MKSGINNTVNNSVSTIMQNFGHSVDELKGDGSKSSVTLADLKKSNPALMVISQCSETANDCWDGS